jgi:NADH:ubiquinone reductase (H+-translocating)
MTIEALVLGGGLAGVACATELAKQGARVTLVDRNDYHQFQPLLYQVATSQLPAADIARPLAHVFPSEGQVELVRAEVAAASCADRSLTLADGRRLQGDVLVLAAGGLPDYHGVPGAAEHTIPLYSVADAERLRQHMRGVLERMEGGDASATGDIVVVGAGPTGVETSGALAELLTALVAMGRLSDPAPRVHIVDAGKALLGPFSDKAHDYAHKALTKDGVEIHLGRGVQSIEAGRVTLDDGTVLTADTVIWAGGEQGASVVRDSGAPIGHGGRIDVAADLSVPGFDGVYAIGDVANVPAGEHDDAPHGILPQLGSVAAQGGTWAARNALAVAGGGKTEPFHYKDKGIMAMIGRNSAVAELGRRRHEIDGPLAFGAWLGVHAMLLSGVHSRTDAFLEWARDYVDRDHAAVVESWSTPSRIVFGEDSDEGPHIAGEGAPQGAEGGSS